LVTSGNLVTEHFAITAAGRTVAVSAAAVELSAAVVATTISVAVPVHFEPEDWSFESLYQPVILLPVMKYMHEETFKDDKSLKGMIFNIKWQIWLK
jgi:hypothetical protein